MIAVLFEANLIVSSHNCRLIKPLVQNVPISIQNDFSAAANAFTWSKQADIIYLHQPSGVGFSTSDATGYVADEDQMADDFF
jgi:carboxypeptidase D